MTRFILPFLFFLATIVVGTANAGALQGKAYILDPTGMPLGQPTPGWDDISGDIHIEAKDMSIDPWGPVFYDMVETVDVEILDAGTYDRVAGTVTVLDGQVGAHIYLQYGYNPMYVFMVWDVTDSGTTFTIVDSDGDGIPGHAMMNGPFYGLTVYYEFEAEPSGPVGPNVSVSVNIAGGNVQECTGNSMAQVEMHAVPVLVGGAVLESISWTVDGEPAGTGLSLTESLALGSHTVEATALATTGESDSASAGIEVEDTTRPVVNVAFLDSQGNEVSSAAHGQVEISIEATDTCDPAPVITSSTATPTTQVSDGDVLQVNASLGNLKLPTTAINVSATARDASGNFSLVTETSSRTLVLE